MAIKLNGSTSGSVALDAPADTSPSGTDVTLTLPTSAGSSGQVLQTNGSGTLSWADIGDTGRILQVVQASGTSTVSTTSSATYTSLLSPTITLSSTSNHVLIFATTKLNVDGNSNAFAQAGVFLTSVSGTQILKTSNGVQNSVDATFQMICLGRHSPASTDEQTYVFGIRKGSGSTTSVSTDAEKYEIILMEVAG